MHGFHSFFTVDIWGFRCWARWVEKVQLLHLQCVLCVFSTGRLVMCLLLQLCRTLAETCTDVLKTFCSNTLHTLFSSCTKLFNVVSDFHRSKWWSNELDRSESGCSGCVLRKREPVFSEAATWCILASGWYLSGSIMFRLTANPSVGIMALLYCTIEDGECRNKPAVDISTVSCKAEFATMHQFLLSPKCLYAWSVSIRENTYSSQVCFCKSQPFRIK